MHELSIAMSIIEGATEEARRHGVIKINAVHLKLGTLSGVGKDALLFSFDLACEGTALEGSRLVIEEIPATAFCSRCEAERSLASIQQMCCSVCGAPARQIAQGTEIEMVALEVTA
ncbi:MAG: hydrogenase maturation nickel metallochaperone HypA [Blastocatellales bacterium]